MNSFPENLIEQAKESAEQAAKKAAELKAEAEKAEQIHQLLAAMFLYLSKGWMFHILDLKQQQAPLLKTMASEHHPAMAAFEEVYHLAAEQAAKFSPVHFPKALADACNDAGLPIDKESRHPTYLFDHNFFKLTINESKKTARLSNYEAKALWEMPADAGAIVEGIQREHQRLFERKFDGAEFLKMLRTQYLALLKQEKKKDGESIPIRDITRRLGKNKDKFRTDEFLIDLSRLVKDGPTEIDGRCLELQQTKDENRGMLLYGKDGRGYVGFVVFK
ncbi:MAG: hypothetical protein Kow00121_06320 [Elainellaceae cyanobacterium]